MSARYRLLRTIASGGMAQVYEAIAVGEKGFERRVAIKRVLPEHAHDEAVRRMFLDEARIASRLHHGGIVQVLDYGVADDTELIVMEFVDGIDALRACQRGARSGHPIEGALALHIVAEVAHALRYAHGCKDDDGKPLKIVHRDVSPQNVLLSWDGDIKLSDFGIAIATQREERTATGIVKGKFAYMPPEQAAGRPVTAAADVYALGATLHALLTGAPPASSLRRRPGEDVHVDSEIDEEAAELVRACMTQDPAGRPTAEAVAYRAGQLAARRLERDARGALRDWLAGLRAAPSRMSPLDDVMGLALIPSGERRFTVSRVAEPGEAAGPELASALAAPDHPLNAKVVIRGMPDGSVPDDAPDLGSAPALPVTRTGRRVAASLIGLAVVLGGIVAWVTVQGADTPRDPVAAETPPAASEDAVDAATASPTEPVALPEGREPPEGEDAGPARPPPEAPSHPPPVRDPSGATSMTTGPDTPVAEPDPPEQPVEPAETGEAFARVPRYGEGQERVEVDGRPRGFTPALLRLGVGTHHITVVDVETGAVRLDRTVELATQHTRVAPLVVR